MLVTFVLIMVTFFEPDVMKWMIENTEMIPIVFCTNLTCQCLLLCFRQLNRKVPINYILLSIITVSQSYILAVIC